MNWSGHWHGYGPWTGSRDEYGEERLRRPGASPGDEQTLAFMASTLPPLMTGHALLRRNQAAAGRTWTGIQEAVAFLTETYAGRPPREGACIPLDVKIRDAGEHLPFGKDVVWAYYTRDGAFLSCEVICCPNFFHPDIPCPCPPGKLR